VQHADNHLRQWVQASLQLSTFLGVAMIGIIWVGFALHLSMEQKRVLEAAKQNTGNLARVFEEHIVRSIEGADAALLSLRAAYAQNPKQFDIKNARVYQSDLILKIGIIGPDGFLEAATNAPPPPDTRIDLSDQEHYRVHLNTDKDSLFISKPLFGRRTGRAYIQLSRRLSRPDGSFGGVIVASIDPSYLSRFYDSIDLGKDGSTSILGLDGVARAARGYTEMEKELPFEGRLLSKKIQESPTGFYITRGSNINRVRRLISYRKLESLPLIVQVGLAQHEVFADYSLDRRTYYIVAAVLTVIILLTIGFGAARKRGLALAAVSARRSQMLLEAERDRNREFLNLIIENVPVPVFVKDASDRRYVLINRAAETFWGIRREEMIGRTAYDMFPERDADLIVARDDELVRSGELNYGEREMQTPRNGIRFASSKRLTVSDCDGKPKYLIGVLEDATERRRLEGERDRSQTFLNTIIENVPAPIFVKEASSLRYVLVNRAGESFWGVSRDKMIGKTSREIFAKEEADAIAARDEQLLQSGQPSFDEREFLTPCNGVRSVVSKRLVVSDNDGKSRYVVGVIEDVTERKLAEAQISNMARRDALTGIANRTVLRERLEEALVRLRGRQEAFTVLMLDLDGFKYINDSLGHAAGDELLKELARRLHSSLDDSETVARLGGDEFAIIQASKINQREEAIALAVKVLEVVARPFDLDGHNVTVGTSVGIAVAPENGTDSGELLKKADLALYRTKSEGRNSFSFFDEEMSNNATTRHQLLSDLRGALSRNEFELYYQPVIDAETARPCGAEALVRWHHPVEGLMSPDRFIWLAEESGLMEPLGEWILERACSDALSWRENIKVAVNISAAQFRTGKLFDVILCVLAESGLPPERLELEITESMLLQNNESYGVVIQKLKDIGISIVLDDFGTGYCSLSYLTRFSFDKVKIDKSFTQGLSNRADCAAVVASVLTLARGLDMVVTAEGVETKQQFQLLRAAGVNQVQGYLFGRPVPFGELDFSALKQKWQAEEAA
jgi:diguanylate cyclase (GGDEF)-like protein/PAS domain S-box-containing protein